MKDALIGTLSEAHARRARASLRVSKLRRQLAHAEEALGEAKRDVRRAELAIAGELYAKDLALAGQGSAAPPSFEKLMSEVAMASALAEEKNGGGQ